MTAASDRDVIAAAWTGRPGCITLGQARALLAAAQWAGMSARDFAGRMVRMTHAECVEEIKPAGFLHLMDTFVARGFRHHLVPMVTPVQLAALDEGRQRLGLDGRQFGAVLRQVGGVASRRHLDGSGFIAVWEWLARAGSGVPVPGHGEMTVGQVGAIHECAYELGMTSAHLLPYLVQLGGVLRTSQLDARGYHRVLHVLNDLAPGTSMGTTRIKPAPGMVTQAQVNLIWRLWLDFDGWKGDTTPAALDRAIGGLLGFGGGLATLTRAGARTIIDRFMVPRLNDRRAAEGGERPPPAAAPATRAKRGKRRHGGRR